ncbi:MAG: helix-turn-helix domain-containing protein [Pseudonocardiaceae bacterium]|nr:helix-turn-helix domain-containing protein [Pseudonocardiaceae bacterium]
MAAPQNPDRARLAARFRELRAATGLSGNRFAQRLDWVQSRVSKLETGVQIPTEADIAAWVEHTDAGADAATELATLLERARVEYSTWKDAYRKAGGAGGKQADIRQLERGAARIAGFQPAVIPGLLQTPAYARELLTLPCGPLAYAASEGDLDAMVAERIKRQEVLYQGGKQVQLMMGEAALHASVGTVGTLVGQLDRLAMVAGLSGVEVGIVPFATPVLPVSGFDLYDIDLVVVETLTGEQRLDEPQEVAHYVRFFDQLRDTAATGPDSVALIQRVAAQLRG